MSARERLLRATITLLCRHGVHVGLDRIAAEADVALMTIYRQFESKDGLLVAALDRWSAQWFASMRDAGRPDLDPATRVERLWDALEAWLSGEAFYGSPITDATRELRDVPAHPVHEVAAAHRRRWNRLLVELARVTGASDPGLLAGQLELLVEGAVVIASRGGDPVDLDGIRALAQMVVVSCAEPAPDAASQEGSNSPSRTPATNARHSREVNRSTGPCRSLESRTAT
jgi:AcrR family transcriptional regulator